MIPPGLIAAAAGPAIDQVKKTGNGLINTQKELSNHFNHLATSNLATGYDSSNDGTVGGGMFNALTAFAEGMNGIKLEQPKFQGMPIKNKPDVSKPTVELPKPDTGVEVKDLQPNQNSIMNLLQDFDKKTDFSSITAAAQSFKKGGMVKC
jgi:hypothetical protein